MLNCKVFKSKYDTSQMNLNTKKINYYSKENLLLAGLLKKPALINIGKTTSTSCTQNTPVIYEKNLFDKKVGNKLNSTF